MGNAANVIRAAGLIFIAYWIVASFPANQIRAGDSRPSPRRFARGLRGFAFPSLLALTMLAPENVRAPHTLYVNI